MATSPRERPDADPDARLRGAAPEQGPSYDPELENYRGISATGPETEEDVREAKDFAEMIVDTIREGLLVLRLDHTVKAANESFYAMFETTPEATLGRSVYDLGDGQWDLPELRRLLEELLPEDKVLEDYVVEHVFEDAGRRTMVLNARQLDRHRLILLAVEDVSERRGAEEALRRSAEIEELHRFAVEAAEMGTWEITPARHDLHLSAGMARLVGLRPKERVVPHAVWMDRVLPDDRGAVERALEASFGAGAPFELEFRVQPEPRAVRWLFSKGRLTVRDGARHLCGATIDVTTLKETEEALRRSELRRLVAVEAANIGDWQLDPRTNELYWSSKARELLGVGPDEPANFDRALERVHPDDRARVRDEIARATGPGGPGDYTVEFRTVHPDGHVLWLMSRARTLAVEGPDGVSTVYLFGAMIDITERREAEEALRDLTATLEARVERRTREVRALAATLTRAEHEERRRIARILHDDLQQTLFAVQLKLGVTRRSFLVGDDDRVAAMLDELDRRVADAGRLTRDLVVDLSPPVLRGEDLAGVLRWLGTRMHELHGLEVTVEGDDDVRTGDEDLRVMLFQVVRELLFNVVKHADERRATVTLRAEGGRVEVAVADEGPGFDVAAAEAEERAHGGFGLPSVRERLRLFGGALRIASAPGAGTRVTVTVPLRGSGDAEA